MKMSIGRKLQIPSLIIIVLVVGVCTGYGVIRNIIEKASAEVVAMKEMETAIRSTAASTRDYTSAQADFATVAASFQSLQQNIDIEIFGAFMERHSDVLSPEDTWACVESIEAMRKQNGQYKQEIEQLTSNSIEMSRGFVLETSRRLADPDLAVDVTQLERLVIAGADANTSMNYQIQLLFEKFRHDGDGSDDLLGLLDDAIANANVDIQRLADTPFAQMPVQARDSNQRLKNLVQKYVASLEQEKVIASGLVSDMANVILTIEGDSDQAASASFQTVASVFLIFAMAVGALAVLIIAVNALTGRALSKAVAGAIEVVSHVADGDTNLDSFADFMDRRSGDEMDDLRGKLRHMTSALRNRAELAGDIARGNLTGVVNVASEQDELGVAIRTMSSGLNELVTEIQTAGDQISRGSSQVADASQNLSQGATEQAAAIEEIGSSITEIGSQTRQNAESAQTANEQMDVAKQIVGKTSAGMAKMREAMVDIDQSSHEISKINKVIDDIAFQTNLLALNAAVEAARAGKHGKGFAVVAEEVRNLAGRSGKAANEASEQVEGTLSKVKRGAEYIAELEESFKGVVTSAGNVAEIVSTIAVSSQQQAEGIGQIDDALKQIDQVTQGNAAAAEESAAASEELSSQASMMEKMLSRFTLAENDSVREDISVDEENNWDETEAAEYISTSV